MSIIIIIFLLFILWIATGKFVKPPQGKTQIISWFDKHIKTVGLGIPEVTIKETVIPEELRDILLEPKTTTSSDPTRKVRIKVDDTKSSWFYLLFPKNVVTFSYKRKKFKTLKEVRESEGNPRWQPTIPKDSKTGKLLREVNSDDTIILGEWTENMTSLYVREREETGFVFISRDGIKGIKKGYMKIIIWNHSFAVSSIKNFKDDPENAVADLFLHYSKTVDFYDGIQGFSFEKYAEHDSFLQETNRDIWMTGVIVEDIEFTDTFLEPESEDILQKREKVQEQKIQQEINKELVESERLMGQSVAAKQIAEAEGYKKAQLLKAEADANYANVTGKVNNQVQTDLDKKLKENEVEQYRQQKQIDLENGGKLIDKLGEYKGIKDETEIARFNALGRVKGTVVYHESSNKKSGSNLDDVILENMLVANTIVNTKKQKDETE